MLLTNIFVTSNKFNSETICLIILWAIIVISCIIAELIASNFITMWFSIGGCAALIALALNLEWYFQFLIFILVSALSILIFYPLFRKKFLKFKILKTNVESLIGGRAKVINIYHDNPGVKDGVVTFSSTNWIFVKEDANENIKINDIVEVKKIIGVKLYIKKIEKMEVIKER